MKRITAEAMPLYAVPLDKAKEFIKWVWNGREKNGFDMKVMSYPRTIMCSAKDDTGALMYIPLQPVLMYESIASKPEITERQTALSLWRIGELMEQVMHDTGHCEAYFLVKDGDVADICAAHGWEEIDPKKYRMLRRKIEPPVYPTVVEDDTTNDN
jgi:hypothetical protein